MVNTVNKVERLNMTAKDLISLIYKEYLQYIRKSQTFQQK